MKDTAFKYFFILTGLLLLLTALAKLLSIGGHSEILSYADPIFGISYRRLFWLAGSIELIAALSCLFLKSNFWRAWIVAWLSTSFVIYRIGYFLTSNDHLCPCLGTLTDGLHMEQSIANTILKTILAYMLVGSYAVLFCFWRERKRALIVSN